MAKIYDPLGWLAPVTINAKILLQELWRANLDWDTELPPELNHKWTKYRSYLPCVESIKIPRCISNSPKATYDLLGFSDASNVAYSAVVYLRSKNEDGQIIISIVAAKTKVAPIKQITLPRLELCGATLLAKLMDSVKKAIPLHITETHAWTDSTIVLAWISSPSHRWKTFVANRVAEIQRIISPSQWHHVKGEDNPADCASRGISPKDLQLHPLWWSGPAWLRGELQIESTELSIPTEAEEEAKKTHTVVTAHSKMKSETINDFSSLTRLQRVTGYVFRFIRNCSLPKPERKTGFLSIEELNSALMHWIKLVQKEEFHEEIYCIKKNKLLPSNSKLLSLTPGLDDSGCLRVGGRLQNAKIAHGKRHPILLPQKHHLTELIVRYYHSKYLHAGAQLLLANLQNKYWITNGRDVVRRIILKCVVCHRHRQETAQQLMGNLPAARVNPSRPFLQCGVDFAGPFMLRVLKGRGQKQFKGYVAVFVCLVTRAIHLELTSDMTSDAFLASLKRFISRRVKPSDMYSDCGTNFVGANRELKDYINMIKTFPFSESVQSQLADDGIKWHLNPAASPHFGGLWEAGVKSFKYHFKRVVGDHPLNYEEMTTTLTQIEACLNSRPLTSLSTDPNDLQPLTPGHFLIGNSLLAVPEPDLTTMKLNLLSRWQLTQKIVQDFWHRWSSEYLSRLQQRPKWWSQKSNIEAGSLVLIKDERLPPLKWKLGRIIELYPGRDNCVRVAKVKTADGSPLMRSIVKLCPLPIDQDISVQNF